MPLIICAATPADLPWINSNDQEWAVGEHDDHTGFSLENAYRVDVAADENGQRLGWLYAAKDDRSEHLLLQLLYVDADHRCRGVSRALVEDLAASEPYRIVLGAWNRELYDVWIKLGFSYEPAEHDRLGDLNGTMARPALA